MYPKSTIMDDKEVTVSVCMSTYNHQDFIEESLNSVLMQLCNFTYEIILSNDNSTDKTHAVIERYLANHPLRDKVKYYDQSANLGMLSNLIFTLQQARGKYVAFLEGDDYWLEPRKLQMQVDAFEINPNITLVCGGNSVLLPDGKKVEKRMRAENIKQFEFDIDAFQSGVTAHFQTLMIKNSLEFIEKLSRIRRAKDFSLFFFNLQNGSGIYLNEILGVYRLHKLSNWSSKGAENALRWEYEESKELFAYPDNRKQIRKRYFFNTLNYINFIGNSAPAIKRLRILMSIAPLIRSQSELKQMMGILFHLVKK